MDSNSVAPVIEINWKPTGDDIFTGEVPSPLRPPPGCHFHPRCPHAMDHCHREAPALGEVEGRLVACHLYGEFIWQ